jgi:hypothetical protein
MAAVGRGAEAGARSVHLNYAVVRILECRINAVGEQRERRLLADQRRRNSTLSRH